jgi:hypothetical protein
VFSSYGVFPRPYQVLALTGDISLYRTVFSLWVFVGFISNRCTVSVPDYITTMLCYMSIQIAIEALSYLAVSVEDLAVIEFAT